MDGVGEVADYDRRARRSSAQRAACGLGSVWSSALSTAERGWSSCSTDNGDAGHANAHHRSQRELPHPGVCQHAPRDRRIRTTRQPTCCDGDPPCREAHELPRSRGLRLAGRRHPADYRRRVGSRSDVCLRPGELAGLRGPYIESDSEERASRSRECARGRRPVRRAGDAKTARSRRTGSACTIARRRATRNRGSSEWRLYSEEGFASETRTGRRAMSNPSSAFRQLVSVRAFGSDWTSSKLAPRVVSLVTWNSPTTRRSPTGGPRRTRYDPRDTATRYALAPARHRGLGTPAGRSPRGLTDRARAVILVGSYRCYDVG